MRVLNGLMLANLGQCQYLLINIYVVIHREYKYDSISQKTIALKLFSIIRLYLQIFMNILMLLFFKQEQMIVVQIL